MGLPDPEEMRATERAICRFLIILALVNVFIGACIMKCVDSVEENHVSREK
jgi:hypothetical protein